jgi:hypothetical protein
MTDASPDTTPDVGIGGVHVCFVCERVLREDRDEFVAVNDPDAGTRFYCDGHASDALDALSRGETA